MAKIITFANWKGGIGKTTLSVASIMTLARQGKKILVIDLDSNISITGIFKMELRERTSIQLLNGDKVEPYEVSENIDMIPSDMRISKMSNLSDNTLRSALRKMDLSKYDYVFIDPPGTMNALTRNSIKSAHKIIVPGKPSIVDMKAVSYFFGEMEEMELETDVFVVINENDTKRNQEGILDLYKKEFDDFLYPYPISAMKSLKSLTGNVFKYKFSGIAKSYIDRFVLEVVG